MKIFMVFGELLGVSSLCFQTQHELCCGGMLEVLHTILSAIIQVDKPLYMGDMAPILTIDRSLATVQDYCKCVIHFHKPILV